MATNTITIEEEKLQKLSDQSSERRFCAKLDDVYVRTNLVTKAEFREAIISLHDKINSFEVSLDNEDSSEESPLCRQIRRVEARENLLIILMLFMLGRAGCMFVKMFFLSGP